MFCVYICVCCTCCLQVYALGVDGGDIECDCELLVETDEVLYACGARYLMAVGLDILNDIPSLMSID